MADAPIPAGYVRVINRVVDAQGSPVPWTAYVNGEPMRIEREVILPAAMARVVVHQSMYRLDPEAFVASYRLGVAEWGLPTDPIPLAEVERVELLDRDLLPPSQRVGGRDRFGRRLQYVPLHAPIQRTDPLAVGVVDSRSDGVTAVGYGDAFGPR